MNEDVRQYIDAVPEGKSHFERLHDLIMALYPDAEIGMSCQIPTYQTESGWVALGYWKNGVSLYTGNPEHIAEFKDSYPGIKADKNSINLKVTDEIPVTALRQVIQLAIEHPATTRAYPQHR